MMDDALGEAVAAAYHFGPIRACVRLGRVSSSVARVEIAERVCWLKLVTRAHRGLDELESEAEVASELAECGLRVAPAVRRRDGRYAGMLALPDGAVPALLFDEAPGREVEAPSPAQANALGALLGSSTTRTMSPSRTRRSTTGSLDRGSPSSCVRQMLARLIEQLSIRILAPEGYAAVARFDDIVIQDGSSFALKKALSEVFSGRFTTVERAAVEVHATYSGFSDEVSTVEIAADSEEERQFLPKPSTLAGQLLLADRGYPSTKYFDEVDKHGGSFIVRLTRSHDPWVYAAWLGGQRLLLRGPVRLSQFIAQHSGRRMDLDVEYQHGKHVHSFPSLPT